MAASWPREIKLPQKCPFCPALSTRTFDEIGLFQHAIAVSKQSTNPATVRAHSDFLNYLKGRLNNVATAQDHSPLLHWSMKMDSQLQKLNSIIPMPAMTLDFPKKGVRDQGIEAKVVWPWMGIVMNISHEQIAKNGQNNCQGSNGKPISNSPWNIDLKNHFAYLNPRGVQALWNQGLAVLDFGQDLLGYFDVQDFEKGFAQCKRGKLDFQNMIKHRKERVQEMFGWIADENDFNHMNAVGEFLRKRGAVLRAKPRFCEDWTDQLLQDMRSKLREKNMKLMELGKEVCNLQTKVYHMENEKHSAEEQILLKESKHEQELETVNVKMNMLIKSHNDELVREKEKIDSLQAELRECREKCKHLQENNTQSTSDETLIPKLIDLAEEKEVLQDTVEKLIYKEREINDKFQSAMEAAKEVLQKNRKPIGIKKVGFVNEGPWKKAFAQKFKDNEEGWELPCASLISLWNDVYLRDPSWVPYKAVATEGGKFEECIDTNDERLAKLSQEFGAEVFKTVVDALDELREFNPSGRYPIRIAWNFERGRAAQLDEIIKYLASDSSKKRKTASR